MEQFLNAVFCLFAAFLTQCSAHFYLNYPPTIGFDDSLEDTAPCGSFTVDFSTDNVTDFHVGGDTLALTSIHPEATWLFRATLDTTASGGWANLLPAVLQTGLGDFCEKNVVINSSWAGSKGVIGVVQDAPDGILYQCAAVNFVSGTATTVPSSCRNVTGLSGEFTADPKLSSLQVSSAGSATGTGTAATGISKATSTSTSTSKSSTIPSYSGLGQLLWVFVIGSATFLACLL